jgi:uncharacterized membrane protein YhiD involved in acid resistance
MQSLFNNSEQLLILFRLVAAIMLGAIIGLDREAEDIS